MIAEIKAWLNEKGTYQAGVDMFVKLCPGHQLVDLFTTEAESAFKRKMLQQELQQLLAQDPGPPAPDPKKPSLPPAQLPAGKITGLALALNPIGETRLVDLKMMHTKPAQELAKDSKESLPKKRGRWSDPALMDATEKDLHGTWHPLFLEMNNLQARIYDVAKAGQNDPQQKEAAGIMAHRILNLAQQCKAIYRQRDQFFTTGQLPSEPLPFEMPVDPQAAWLEMKNAERYVREYKTKLGKKPGDEKFTERLQYFQNKAALIKAKFNFK